MEIYSISLIVQFIMAPHIYLGRVIAVPLKLTKDGGHTFITFLVSVTLAYEVFFGHS